VGHRRGPSTSPTVHRSIDTGYQPIEETLVESFGQRITSATRLLGILRNGHDGVSGRATTDRSMSEGMLQCSLVDFDEVCRDIQLLTVRNSGWSAPRELYVAQM